MKLFSLSPLSPLLFISLISSSVPAQERELKLVRCQENPKNYINLDELNQKKIFTAQEDPPLSIKVPNGTTQVFVTEELKRSRLSEDMLTLIKLGVHQVFTIVSKDPSNNNREIPQCVNYKHVYIRTNTHIKTVDENNRTTDYSFFIGEKDHFYLSVDMLISSVKELYYEEENKRFIEKEQPSSFYFGFNYKIGDLSTQYPPKEFYKNLSLKAIAKVAKKPNASMGLGLGYHLNKNIEFFITRVWTRDNQNVHREKLGYTPTTTYGISFNLTKALGWLGAE